MIEPDDILPFPLCSGEPELNSFERAKAPGRCYFVHVSGPIEGWDISGPGHDTAIEAITAWNLGMRMLHWP